jgi:hypothetical protein
MLRLFRKTGMQSSVEKKTYWAFTVTEFLLIVLGILLALQIDNWNQKRQEKKLENVLLHELLLNLQSDLKDAVYNDSSLTAIVNSSEIILKYIEEDRPYQDSLEHHFANLTGGTIYNRNLAAYESLKSIGIGLISNNDLRQQITYLYSVRYDYLLKLEELHHHVVIETLYPVIAEQIDLDRTHQKATPLDPSEISKNIVFKENIKRNLVFLDAQIQEYQNIRTLITELIRDIEKELE